MADLAEIASRLGNYLGAPVRRAELLANGWETTVFGIELDASAPRFDLPARAPLVLRRYDGDNGAKGAREFSTMRDLSRAGYCVPRPHLFEPDAAVLDAPFLIMDRLAGGPLFIPASFRTAFKTFALGFFSFVRAQARLHKPDPASLTNGAMPRASILADAPPGTPLLDRALATIAARIERGPLPGLKDALETARSRALLFRDAPASLLHLDYHPRNVMVSGTRVTGVIDWVNADIGDRHFDAAMTAVILSSSAMDHPRWMRDNLIGNTLRRSFALMYLPLYHAMAPLDLERFRYCQGVAALLRLSMLASMRALGPQAEGFRPNAMEEVTPPVLRLLSRYASQKAGVPISLDGGVFAPSPA